MVIYNLITFSSTYCYHAIICHWFIVELRFKVWFWNTNFMTTFCCKWLYGNYGILRWKDIRYTMKGYTKRFTLRNQQIPLNANSTQQWRNLVLTSFLFFFIFLILFLIIFYFYFDTLTSILTKTFLTKNQMVFIRLIWNLIYNCFVSVIGCSLFSNRKMISREFLTILRVLYFTLT